MSTVVLRLPPSGRVYEVVLDGDRTVLLAKVYISAHDKCETWRRVRNPGTLARLQDMITPREKCEACGREI
jgi:hypothetical protein